MRGRRPVRTAWGLLAACALMACSGASIDGGQSGTGIAAVRGSVITVTGGSPDVANIRVSLTGTNLATRTGADGRFELQGNASGPGELLFEREDDGLFARTDVVIPAGGVLELDDIVLDANTGQARPTRQRVEFEGFVETLDCTNGAILVTPKEQEDDLAPAFVVEVMSATIHHDNTPIGCSDLLVGDRLQVRGETSDGLTLINADVRLEDREDPSSDDTLEDSKGTNPPETPGSDDQIEDDAGNNQPEPPGNDDQIEDPTGDDQPEHPGSDDEVVDDAGDDQPELPGDDHKIEDPVGDDQPTPGNDDEIEDPAGDDDQLGEGEEEHAESEHQNGDELEQDGSEDPQRDAVES